MNENHSCTLRRSHCSKAIDLTAVHSTGKKKGTDPIKSGMVLITSAKKYLYRSGSQIQVIIAELNPLFKLSVFQSFSSKQVVYIAGKK